MDHSTELDRGAFVARDATDPLADCRDRFVIPDGLIYLDGNSLGALPRNVPQRMRDVIDTEWGVGLIRSWNDAGWYTAPSRAGATVARLVGADAHEVVVCDSTSVNLFKVLVAAVRLRPGRRTIVAERTSFPTDSYIAVEVARMTGTVIELVASDEIGGAIASAGDDLVAVSLSDVDYRTARRHDMAEITALTHRHGGLAVWDLCHSAGVLPVDLGGCAADFAVGCTYKYLNGGPGAPAFVYVAERHLAAVEQPLPGWHGHAKPFDFEEQFTPAVGIERMLAGTAPQLGLLALEAALEAYDGVDIHAVRAKSIALTDELVALVDARLTEHDFSVISPRDGEQRGSHVSIAHEHGYAITQALIDRGVIGDFRAPDLIRLGVAPLYIRHVDIWDAVDALVDVMARRSWTDARHQRRNTVT